MLQEKSHPFTVHVTLHADVHVLSSMLSSESDMLPHEILPCRTGFMF